MFHIYLFCFLIPNFFTTTCPSEGTYYEKYSGEGSVFETLNELSLSRIMCAAACSQSQPVCIGFKYEKKKTCELLNNVIPGSPSQHTEEMWVAETWIAGNFFISIKKLFKKLKTK